MQIQFNTDKNVHGEASLAAWAEHELRKRMHRFGEQITRIEVHLSDTNGARLAEQDKRCKLEARLAGCDPMVVSHDAAKVADALYGAAEKLARALDTTLGKARNAKGRDTIRGD